MNLYLSYHVNDVNRRMYGWICKIYPIMWMMHAICVAHRMAHACCTAPSYIDIEMETSNNIISRYLSMCNTRHFVFQP